jgi:hypothetical protein
MPCKHTTGSLSGEAEAGSAATWRYAHLSPPAGTESLRTAGGGGQRARGTNRQGGSGRRTVPG